MILTEEMIKELTLITEEEMRTDYYNEFEKLVLQDLISSYDEMIKGYQERQQQYNE
ncbi:MAG: hypothetical protein ACI30H_02670 [Paludibacteraceae bacterium]